MNTSTSVHRVARIEVGDTVKLTHDHDGRSFHCRNLTITAADGGILTLHLFADTDAALLLQFPLEPNPGA